MADRRRGGLGPDRLSHLSSSAPQIYAATGGPRPLAVETLSDDARQPLAQGAARSHRPDLLQAARRAVRLCARGIEGDRSEEHTSELQSLMRISYAVFCLKKKTQETHTTTKETNKKRTKT